MAIKQYVSLNEPLCGIGTYKDTLNLTTGIETRVIKKKVLTGAENWLFIDGTTSDLGYFRIMIGSVGTIVISSSEICSHYNYTLINSTTAGMGFCMQSSTASAGEFIAFRPYSPSTINNLTMFKQFLADQYTAGTPVTVWYVLATPTTSTTALPRGLSGIVEGSLTQSGTPTPANPIYPTANSIDAFLDKKYLKYGTETDTITMLPKTIIGDGQSASAVIKGNLTQSGAPTPSAPIYPTECGDKTANLFDGNYDNAYINANGVYIAPDNTTICAIVKCEPNTTYTIKQIEGVVSGSHKWKIAVYTSLPTNGAQGTMLVNDDTLDISTITTLSDSKYMAIYYLYKGVTYQSEFMVNKGSTALPYEPYGYKIPISSANTTTPIYLGEVPTTRRIRKYEFTGQENWQLYSSNYWTNALDSTAKASQIPLCSHFLCSTSTGIYISNGSVRTKVYAASAIDVAQSLDEWKSYLATQYAAGTPVTVWYVLSTATTGTLNEPIRKIGDYADEVSGITIPTIAGANTLSIGTTLQPSEVTATYKGWHPVADVHEYRGGGTNLFDAEAAYGELYNDGVVSGTPQQIYAVKNYFTSDEIGKQLTISVYAESVTSNRVEMFVYINGVRTTSNSIDRGQQGTMTFTVIPTSTSDNWTITYGSGSDINSFSNLTVTEEPHWD